MTRIEQLEEIGRLTMKVRELEEYQEEYFERERKLKAEIFHKNYKIQRLEDGLLLLKETCMGVIKANKEEVRDEV